MITRVNNKCSGVSINPAFSNCSNCIIYLYLCFGSGQGTISLELLDQVPEIDTIIAPISGLFNQSVSCYLLLPTSVYIFCC